VAGIGALVFNRLEVSINRSTLLPEGSGAEELGTPEIATQDFGLAETVVANSSTTIQTGL
jgi:hypothetical protein